MPHATRHQNVVTLSALSAEPQDVSALTINKNIKEELDLEGKPFFLTDGAGGWVNVCLMLGFVSRVCLCVSTFTVFKYTQHKEKYQPFLGLFFKNNFIFYLCLNSTHESKAEGHLAISGLILGDGTWTDSLFSSLLQTHLPLAIPQL